MWATKNLISSLTSLDRERTSPGSKLPTQSQGTAQKNNVVSINGGSEDDKVDIRDVEIEQDKGLELLFRSESSDMVSEEEEGKCGW